MASAVGAKPPISILQELCMKWGIVPTYELLAHQGPVHDPVFEYNVKAGEHSAVGRGNSKKRAKHNAAETLLNKLRSTSNSAFLTEAVSATRNGDIASAQHLSEKASTPGTDEIETSDINPVGQLQEFTQKRRLPQPTYECTSECGPAHSRYYTYTVHLLGLTERGEGPSKKSAKKNAALAMLRCVTNCADDILLNVERSVAVAHPTQFDDKLIEAVRELKLGNRKVDTLNPQASQKINQFYTALKAKCGKTLASLQGLSLNVPATNYCQMLEEIAEEQSFVSTYVDLHEITADERYQCLVQLSTLPVAVCHGVGRTKDEAHSDAAHCALQYLKIMTRKI